MNNLLPFLCGLIWTVVVGLLVWDTWLRGDDD